MSKVIHTREVVQIRAFRDLIQPIWSIETIAALTQGPRRWTELVTILTVTSGKTVHSRSLSCALQHLQEHGIIDHPTMEADGPVYRLSCEGRDLVPVLSEVASWVDRHSDLRLP